MTRCDHCQKNLSDAELGSAKTLRVKGKVFCAGCAPKVLAALKRRKKTAGTRPRRATEAAEAAVDPREFRLHKRSRAPVVVIVSVLGLAAIILVIAVFERPERRAPIGSPAAKPDISAILAKDKEEKAQEALAKALEFQRKYPTHYDQAIRNFHQVARVFTGTAAATEATKKAQAIRDTWRPEAARFWGVLRAEVEALSRDEKFQRAFEKMQTLPPILIGAGNLEQEFHNLRKDVVVQRDALARLAELGETALRYLEQKNDDIAIYVLREFEKKFEQDAPVVWALKDRTIAIIEKNDRVRAIEKLRGVLGAD